MLLRSRIALLLGGLVLISGGLLLHFQISRHTSSAGWPHPEEWLPEPMLDKVVKPKCSLEIDWLRRADRPSTFNYARREIIVKSNPDVTRSLITKVDEKLFGRTQEIDLSENSVTKWKHCQDPLILEVPAIPSEPADASHIIFGISTTMKRLEDTIPALMRWIPKTQAKLVVIVIEDDERRANDKEMEALQKHMRDLGIEATLVHPMSDEYNFSEKYFSLVKEMYKHKNEKTKWVSLIDDDTFFPSMPALISMLDSYDATKEYYLGAISEDWWSTSIYGIMGFGGAGIFLSLPLAAILDKLHDSCLKRSRTTAGDIRVKECIIWNTDNKLVSIRDLHQMDLGGDLSGFFESGRLPLSLHHWKGDKWEGMPIPLPEMHRIADICGECFLQRWQFGNDMILTNAISIATYPKHGVDFDTDKLEMTWRHGNLVEGTINAGWDHSLPPTRPGLVLDEEKIRFALREMEVVDQRSIRQTYVHEGVDGGLDTVYDLIWRRDDEAQRGA